MSTEDEDAALIDRLYGGEDVGGLGSVRAMVARVREEQADLEPPQAVIAKLLLAAEEHAPKRKVVEERAGLWGRLRGWMAPMLAHPGLAAAATLVVVAGATAVWMGRGGEIAEPTRHAEVATSDEAPAFDGVKGEAAGGSAVASAPTATPTSPLAEPTRAPSAPRPLDEAPAKPERSVSRERVPTKKAARKEPTAEGRGFEDDVRRDAPATAGVKASVGGQNAPAQAAREQTTAPPPPPPPVAAEPAPAPADQEARAPEASHDKPEEKPAPKPVDRATRLRQLTDQARTAAKQGDCKRVAALGAEVKTLDASYYEKTFSTDASISACRSAR